MFITFEGGEGSGKSTQVNLLAARLRLHGKEVFTTREPGGTPDAELVRSLLVSGDPSRWTSEEELLLVTVGRSNHLRHVIKPKLEQGIYVICDRFVDSTYVYQSFAGTVTFEFFREVSVPMIGNSWPNLTIVLDIDPWIGIPRSRNRMANLKMASELATSEAIQKSSMELIGVAGTLSTAANEDRFERKQIDFHQKVREGFIEVATRNPDRCKLIDANRPAQIIADDIWTLLNGHS
jgi:dTMP kinase